MTCLEGSVVLVTGGAGFLGRRIVAALDRCSALPVTVRSAEYDLTDQEQVRSVLRKLRPQHVVHAAAVVGGIGANRAHPASFFYDNAAMGVHLIHEAWRAGVERIVIVGTVCSYPKYSSVPFLEQDLWSGYPEETNAPYGLAKRMLVVQAQAYRAEHGLDASVVIPTNLYGPGDTFDPETSHVIPAMIRAMVEARRHGADRVTLWGTGLATREFLHVTDAAEGIVRALEDYHLPEPLNLGAGEEISIRDLSALIAGLTRFEGEIGWDTSKPDGQPRRSVDGSRARELLGWRPTIGLRDGLAETVRWYERSREPVGVGP